MRLERTVIHRVGPFEHFELDLTKTLGPLIAVVAPNGSGKSFLLEASILGAAFRRMPSQGRLLARATAADAYLESTFVNGSRHTVRHLLGRKAEALVLLEDGVTPAYEDDVSVGAFDEWVQAHFPDQELLCATQFAVQKSEGFIGMGSAARIDVILSATGVSRIDRMSKLAGKRASEVAAKLATNRQRLADAREGAPELAEAEAEFVRVNGEADAAETRAAAARAALAAAEAEGLRVAELRRQAVAAGDAREALERAAWKAIDRRASLERRLAENDPETAEAEAREHDVALGTLRGLLAGIEAEAVDVAAARAASEGQAAARARVVGDIDATRASLAEATKLLQNCRGRVERAEEIRAADAEAKTLIVEMASASQREEQAVSDARREAREIFDLERRIAGLGVRAERAREALRDRATVEQAEAGLADVDAEATAAAAAHAAAVAEVERLQGERVAGAEERIDGLRVGLARIASADGVPAHELQGSAHETLGEDDDAAAVAERHPAELAAAVAARGEAEARATAASKALDAYRSKVARRASIQHAEEELAAVERESAELTERRDACVTSADRRAVALAMLRLRRASQATRLEALAPVAKLLEGLVQAQGNLELRERQVATATERLAALEAELAGLPLPAPVEDGPDLETARGVVSHVEHLTREAAARAAAVKATRAELEPQLEAARAEVTRLDAELAALPAPAELPPLPDVDAARAESETAEQALRDASTAIARAEQRLGQARAAAAKIASLEEERSGLEYQLANWTRLELDFGRDGIQSALVDSAGPELSELANDLLRCHGTRFSVAIETKRAKSNGKGETDECRVLVVDSERGTQKEAREHSGGECVIIGEAISLALTMMACRRAGVVEPTLVRDESSAALDPESARAYVTMLRRAAAFVNAHRVLVVSHSREVQELCDSTITLPSRQRPEA